jgi:hypothetical protein
VVLEAVSVALGGEQIGPHLGASAARLTPRIRHALARPHVGTTAVLDR